jgi:DNA-binding NarL/FixJ family response regulator
MASSNEAQILALLDQILNVLAVDVQPDRSLTERARLLKLAGLDNARIADALNTTTSTVSVMTTRLRERPIGSAAAKPAKRTKGKIKRKGK